MGTNYPELFILRHGQTEWNREKRAQGWMDSPLTDLGREQARTQNELLQQAGLPADTSFHCSPLGRTRQTAALALAGLTRDIHFDERLKEVSVGECEGLLIDDCIKRWPEVFATGLWGEWCFIAPGSEGFAAFSARIQSWLDELSGPDCLPDQTPKPIHA
jgi:probable phosphoglycerate mutase